MTERLYGQLIARSVWLPRRSVVAIDRSPNGNVILRGGKENEGGDGWHQTIHVVLQPEEAREFINEIERSLG